MKITETDLFIARKAAEWVHAKTCGQFELDDLIGEANLSLVRNAGCKTLRIAIERDIWDAVRKWTKWKSKVHRISFVSLEETLRDSDLSRVQPVADTPDVLDRVFVDECLSVLNDRYRSIVERHFLGNETQEEISRAEGVGQSRISEIIAESLHQIRLAIGLIQRPVPAPVEVVVMPETPRDFTSWLASITGVAA